MGALSCNIYYFKLLVAYSKKLQEIKIAWILKMWFQNVNSHLYYMPTNVIFWVDIVEASFCRPQCTKYTQSNLTFQGLL
jgi:hypothetical protein